MQKQNSFKFPNSIPIHYSTLILYHVCTDYRLVSYIQNKIQYKCRITDELQIAVFVGHKSCNVCFFLQYEQNI